MNNKTPYKIIQDHLNDMVRRSLITSLDAQNEIEKIKDLFKRYSPDMDEMIENYRNISSEYIKEFKENEGVLLCGISNNGNQKKILSINGNIEELYICVDRILEKSVKKYREQVLDYYNKTLDDFCDCFCELLFPIIDNKLSLDDAKREIKYISQYFRSSIKWYKTFEILKNQCISKSIKNIVYLSKDPTAAIWVYNNIDEQMDYPNYKHKKHDGKIFIVRNSYAQKKGLICEDVTYLDTVIDDMMDVGCGCYLTFLYGIDRIPQDLLTKEGQRALSELEDSLKDNSPITISSVPSLTSASESQMPPASKPVPLVDPPRRRWWPFG